MSQDVSRFNFGSRVSPASCFHTSPRYIRHLQRLAESEGHYYRRQVALYRISSAFLVGKLQAEALIRSELVPLGAEVIRIDDYFKDRHFVANLLRYTIANALSRAALWRTIAVYMEDLAVLDNSMASTQKVRLMTCVEGLLNTGIYHLEKSIRKTVILTVGSARDLFERDQDGDPTFSQLRFRSDPNKPNLDPSSLEYALVTFALLFGTGDAHEEHQVRNYLARKFMEAKKDTMPKINGLLLQLLTRWLRLLVFLLLSHVDFSRKTGFARINLDLVTRLPHDQRITSLDEKNRLLQKVVDDTPLESIIPTLGSLKDTATFKRVWNAFDVAACQFGSGHSGIEHILGIELRCTGSVSHQRHADKRISPQAGKPSDRGKSAIQNLVQPSPPSPVDSNICRVSLSGEVLSSERGGAKAAATARTHVDDSESNALATSPSHACSDKSTHRLEAREVSSSVEDLIDGEFEDGFPGLFVGAISFGEPPSNKKQQKSTSKSKKSASASEPVRQWTYPVYVKYKTLKTFRLILDSKAKGTLKYKDFEQAMADLDFLIEPGGKGSTIFRPPGASINKQPFICDPPHNAKLGVDDTFRLRIRTHFRQHYGWSESKKGPSGPSKIDQMQYGDSDGVTILPGYYLYRSHRGCEQNGRSFVEFDEHYAF
ncbi:hypothetical protein ARMGADRAFT_1064723 [Armillaria gallica]|uniref:Uncharacterized protein n=1 Tax=Armillaria gallica TaxID=47427 RepID=A0A2H3D4P3_ARMGA|nr:hypothetical protein ARMGADRAFT_1064723 [Armillaria gallica]